MTQWKKQAKEYKERLTEEGRNACSLLADRMGLQEHEREELTQHCLDDWMKVDKPDRTELKVACSLQNDDQGSQQACEALWSMKPTHVLREFTERMLTSVDNCLNEIDATVSSETVYLKAEKCFALLPRMENQDVKLYTTDATLPRPERKRKPQNLPKQRERRQNRQDHGTPLIWKRAKILKLLRQGYSVEEILTLFKEKHHTTINPSWLTTLREQLGAESDGVADDHSAPMGDVLASSEPSATFQLPVPFHTAKRKNYCTVASLQMVLDFYGIDPVPDQDLMKPHCQYFEVCDVRPLHERYGLTVRKLHLQGVEELYEALKHGDPVILRIKNPRTHSVVFHGFQWAITHSGELEVTNFLFHDPAKQESPSVLPKEQLLDQWHQTDEYAMIFEPLPADAGAEPLDFRYPPIVVDTNILISFQSNIGFLCEIFQKILIPSAVFEEAKDVRFMDVQDEDLLQCLEIKELPLKTRMIVDRLFRFYASWLVQIRRLAIKPEHQRADIEGLVLALDENRDFVSNDGELLDFAALLWLIHEDVEEIPVALKERGVVLEAGELEGIDQIQVVPMAYILYKAIDLCREYVQIGEKNRADGILRMVETLLVLYRENLKRSDQEDLHKKIHSLRGDDMPRDATKSKKIKVPQEIWEQVLAAVRARDWERYLIIMEEIRAQYSWEMATTIRFNLERTHEWREYSRELAAKSFQKQLPMLQQCCTPEQIEGIRYYSKRGDILGAARKCGIHPTQFLAWLRSIGFSLYLSEDVLKDE